MEIYMFQCYSDIISKPWKPRLEPFPSNAHQQRSSTMRNSKVTIHTLDESAFSNHPTPQISLSALQVTFPLKNALPERYFTLKELHLMFLVYITPHANTTRELTRRLRRAKCGAWVGICCVPT